MGPIQRDIVQLKRSRDEGVHRSADILESTCSHIRYGVVFILTIMFDLPPFVAVPA
jgi:hypothetical protein